MNRKFSLSVAVFSFALTLLAGTAMAQTYSVTQFPNAGNPGGVNMTADNSTAGGWSAIGTVALTANAWTTTQTLPFAFSFYGTPVTQFKASHNGVVTFDVAATAVPGDNAAMPTATLPDNSIGAFWDAFTSNPPTGTNDQIYINTLGTAPNRQFWIKWFSFEYGSPGMSFSYFAVVLEETTNKVYVVEMYESGSVSSTVGVQQNSTNGTQFGANVDMSNPGISITDNTYYEFTPLLPGLTMTDSSAGGVVVGAPSDVVALDISAASVGSNTDITSITFTKTGTIADAEITNVELFLDNNNDGAVDAGDTPLGSGTYASGSLTLSGTPLQQVVQGTPARLLLAYDLATGIAIGTTFGAEITAATDVSIGAQTDNSIYPLTGATYTVDNTLSLTTLFSGATTGGNGGNAFDLTTGTSPILVTQFDIHMAVTTSQVVDFYYKVGTYSGFEQNAGAWTLHDTVTVTGAGANTPTPMPLNSPLLVPANSTYGFAILARTTALRYTTGTGTYSDSFVTLDLGSQVATGFSGSITGRQWNGTVYYQPDPDGVVLANGALAGGTSGTGLTDFVSMDFEVFALTNGRDLNSVTFTNTGTAPDSVFTAVELVRDDNNNGVIDATDTVLGTGTLSAGSITFSSAPLPQTVTTAAPVRMLLGVTTTGLVVGDSFRFEISSSSDISWSGGTDYTGYPFQGPNWVVAGPAVSYPYFLGFETPEPYFNGTFDTAPTSIPTVVTVGGTPGTDTLTSTLNDYVVTTGPVAGSSPHSGSFMLDLFGGSTAGAVALDLDFDMSTFSLTDYVEFEFWWNDEGIDNSATTNDRLGVFISTNGGTTWELAAYQFPHSLNTGVWNHVLMDLSPMLSALSLTYTNQMVIRFQISESITSDHLLLDDIRIDRPAPQLRVTPAAQTAGAAFAGTTDQVVAEISTFSVNSTQALNAVTLTQIGTASNGDLSNLKLWEDTNNDGVLNTGDTQLGSTVASMSGATVTFTATPLRNYTLNEVETLFVTADIAAAPTTPAVVQFSLVSASDATATPGFVGGVFPVDFAAVAIKVPVSTFPYVQDFETALPYNNVLFSTNGASVPTVAAVGMPSGAPASYTLPGGFQISAITAGSPPNTGTGMIELSGTTNIGFVGMDLLFDMSAFDVSTDTFDLEFFWNDEGIDNSGDTNEALGVFLSNDGGATWGIALYQFPHSLNIGVWNQVNMDLSAMLAAVGMNYTSQVVLRFQFAEDNAVDYLLIDDITLSQATTPELRVTTGPAGRPMAALPGDTDVVLGNFRFDAIASTQDVSGVNVSLNGSLAETELTNVRLYEDTNGDNVFNAGDTQLGTAGTFSSGSLFFAATSLTMINNTAPTLFVVADLAGTAPSGDTFSVSIDGGVLAINTTPGPVTAAASVSGGVAISVIQPASTPALQGFETNPPYVDGLLTNESVMPTVTTVGGIPSVASLGGTSSAFVTTGPVSGSSPFAGSQMVDIAGATGNGGSAVNLFYDMSAFSPSDVVQLQFAWNNEGLDPDSATIFNERFMGVFLSTDAGLTWEAVVFQFDPNVTDGVWNQETINLSSIMSGLSLSYTDRMVLRFQSVESSTADHLLLDEITVEVAQEIDVQRNATSIPNGGFEVVGPIPVSANQTFTLDILNSAPTGANDLSLTGTPAVQIGTTTNASASISAQPASTTLVAGASDTFDVDISPNAGGAYVVELIIPNDDPDEAPYILTLVGTGVEPEIDVQRPAGTSIPDGSTDSYGSIAAGVSNMFTYFIVNGGNATLNLTGTPAVNIQNVVNATVNVTLQPSSTALAPAALAPFDLDVTPNLGAFSFEIVITNNDANEGNYTIMVAGNGATTPEIDVKDSVGTDVFEGGVFTLGNIAPGSTDTLTLTIENNGNADLLLSGTPTIEILSPSNVTANVTATPATTIPVSGSDVFTIDITPTNTGSFSFQVRIQNNDANEGSYTFTISGFSSTPVKGGGGDDGGGCSTGDTDLGLWSLLLGALALIAVATRVRASRD